MILGTAIAPTPRKPFSRMASAAATTSAVEAPPDAATTETLGLSAMVSMLSPAFLIADKALIYA